MDMLDPLNLCRLCLCRSECFIDIFGENVDLGFDVGKTIQDLLQFHVTRVEGVPSLACSTCVEELNHFRIFKSRCVDSKVTFEKRLSMRQRNAEICGRNYGKMVVAAVYGRDVSGGDVTADGLEGRRGSEDGVPMVTEIDADDTPIRIVKVEGGTERVPRHAARHAYQTGLSEGDDDFESCEDGGDSEADGRGEVHYGTQQDEVVGSGERTGGDYAGMPSLVLVKTESLAEDSLAESGEFVEEYSASENDHDGCNASEGWDLGEEDVGSEPPGRMSDAGIASLVVVKTESLAGESLPAPEEFVEDPGSPRMRRSSRSPSVMPKRSRYTERFKRTVVQFADKTSAHLASEHFGIPGRNVRRWRLQARKMYR